jgi:hypothetical protein
MLPSSLSLPIAPNRSSHYFLYLHHPRRGWRREERAGGAQAVFHLSSGATVDSLHVPLRSASTPRSTLMATLKAVLGTVKPPRTREDLIIPLILQPTAREQRSEWRASRRRAVSDARRELLEEAHPVLGSSRAGLAPGP